jgi:hypothetical protein
MRRNDKDGDYCLFDEASAEIERLRKLCAEASRALEDVGESANDGAYIGLEKRLDAAGRGEKI